MEIPYEMKMESVKVNFQNMLSRGTFYISDFNECAKLLGVHVPTAVNDFLQPLSCCKWGDMNPKMRKYVLELIVQVFNQEPAMYLSTEGEVVGTQLGFQLDNTGSQVKFKMTKPMTGEIVSVEQL